MKTNKISIQITFDVEYKTINPDSDQMPKNLLQGLEDCIHKAVGSGLLSSERECEIESWNTRLRLADPDKEKAQFQSERVTPFANITAYFSSDGPAVIANIHGIPLGAASDAMELTLADINGTLREAHHKYVAHLRGT